MSPDTQRTHQPLLSSPDIVVALKHAGDVAHGNVQWLQLLHFEAMAESSEQINLDQRKQWPCLNRFTTFYHSKLPTSAVASQFSSSDNVLARATGLSGNYAETTPNGHRQNPT